MHSGLGAFQDVQHSSKKLSQYLSVNVSQFKTFRQDFGQETLQDSLEASSNLLVTYQVKNSVHVYSDFGFTYSRQDIGSVGTQNTDLVRQEKMFFGALGVQKMFLRGLRLDANVGAVRCKHYASGEVNLFPTAAISLNQRIKTMDLSFTVASEALGGGSFTGIYGNQMLHHAKLGFRLPISNKFGLESEVAFGQTRDAFEGNQKAHIFASSVSVNYALNDNVSFGMGVFNRALTNEDQFQNVVNEGAMYMATMQVSYF